MVITAHLVHKPILMWNTEMLEIKKHASYQTWLKKSGLNSKRAQKVNNCFAF